MTVPALVDSTRKKKLIRVDLGIPTFVWSRSRGVYMYVAAWALRAI